MLCTVNSKMELRLDFWFPQRIWGFMENNLGNSDVIIIVDLAGLFLLLLSFVPHDGNWLLIVQNLCHSYCYSHFIFEGCNRQATLNNNRLIVIKKLSVKSHNLVLLLPHLLILQCFVVGILLTLLHTWGKWVLDTSFQSHTLREYQHLHCNFDLSQLEASNGFGVLA